MCEKLRELFSTLTSLCPILQIDITCKHNLLLSFVQHAFYMKNTERRSEKFRLPGIIANKISIS